MLEVRDYSFAGKLQVSFEVHAQECLAVMGPSGTGKSLLLRALADLDQHEGQVFLNGQAQEQMPATNWRKMVTYVSGELGWWDEYVHEHFSDVALGTDLLSKLLLPKEAMSWPTSRLSTGESQRLLLARALILSPKVLLLDEPTSGLDPEATSAVEALLKDYLSTGNAIVMVTHDLAQARRLGKRTLFLKKTNAKLELL